MLLMWYCILMNVSKIIILYWLRHIKNILKDGFKIMEIIIITTTTILQAFQIHILMICVGLVLTLLRMSEVLDDNKFADTAQEVV